MKKLVLGFILMLSLLITGCDNNEGPYETKKENGKLFVYSDGKPAKGIIASTMRDRSGNSVVVSEIYYDKGLPAGDFKLRNLNGYIIAEAKGKWIEPGYFEGTINSHDSKSKGIYSINTDYLINFDQYLNFPIQDCLVDGEYNKQYSDGSSEHIIKKDDIIREHTYLYPDRQILSKTIFDENGYKIESTSFHPNRQMAVHFKSTDISNITKKWTEDGELIEINERDENYKTLESYSVFAKEGELIPFHYSYNKNGIEIEIDIDPHAEIGRGFRVCKMKGVETEDEAEKILPKRLMNYIKTGIELHEKDKKGE